MKRRTATLACLAILVAVGTGIWLAGHFGSRNSPYEPANPATPLISSKQVDFAKVEAAALNSCLCRREGKSDEECETIYASERDALLAQIYGSADVETEGVAATACAPVSSSTECFAFTDGTKCVDLGFDVVVASRDIEVREVCTIVEARAIEQANQEAWLGPDRQEPSPGDEAAWEAANQRSNAATDAMLRRILAGGPVPEATFEGGCTG